MKYNFTVYNKRVSSDSKILLLHGWGGSLNSLSPLAEKLSKLTDKTIFNLELPGFGKTEPTSDSMHTSDFANFVKGFCKSKDLDKIILIGHSFGGKIGTHLVAENWEPIEKLVLINASGIKSKNSFKKKSVGFLKRLVPNKIQENEKLKKLFYKSIGAHDYMNANKMKKTLSNVVEEHYDEKLGKINVETQIIWGENDSYVPLWMGRKLDKEIQNSNLIVVPGATHGLPLKQPELVAELIFNGF